MKRIGLVSSLAALAFTAIAGPAFAGDAEVQLLKKLLRAQTAAPAATVEPQAAVSANATIQVTANITIKSPSYNPAKLNCSVELSDADNYNFNDIRTIAVVPAAGKATCAVKMAIYWPNLAAAPIGNIEFSVYDDGTEDNMPRYYRRVIAEDVALPTNGTTKAYTINVTL